MEVTRVDLVLVVHMSHLLVSSKLVHWSPVFTQGAPDVYNQHMAIPSQDTVLSFIHQ